MQQDIKDLLDSLYAVINRNIEIAKDTRFSDMERGKYYTISQAYTVIAMRLESILRKGVES